MSDLKFWWVTILSVFTATAALIAGTAGSHMLGASGSLSTIIGVLAALVVCALDVLYIMGCYGLLGRRS